MSRFGGRRLATLLFLAFAIQSGCVERSTALTSAEREELRTRVTRSPSHPSQQTKVDYRGVVHLVGFDAPASVRPGVPFEVTWHWHVVGSFPGKGWRLFTHLEGKPGSDWVNLDNAGALREGRPTRPAGLYPPDRWKKGDWIADHQTITLPLSWSSRAATFYLGFYNGNSRLEIREGPNDGDDRSPALTIPVENAEQPQIPELHARFSATAPKLDGKLDESGWEQAQHVSLVDPMTGGTASLPGTVRLMWNQTHLFLAFEVRDPDLKSSLENRDDSLWTQDTVEWMIDPGGDGRGYYELQISPRGVIFDTRYDSRRQPGPSGHTSWNANLEAGVRLQGTLNDSRADEGYVVEAALAWSSLSRSGSTLEAVEKPLRMNFYVMSDNTRAAGAWSPPLEGDFHVPHRFGTVHFDGQP